MTPQYKDIIETDAADYEVTHVHARQVFAVDLATGEPAVFGLNELETVEVALWRVK